MTKAEFELLEDCVTCVQKLRDEGWTEVLGVDVDALLKRLEEI